MASPYLFFGRAFEKLHFSKQPISFFYIKIYFKQSDSLSIYWKRSNIIENCYENAVLGLRGVFERSLLVAISHEIFVRNHTNFDPNAKGQEIRLFSSFLKFLRNVCQTTNLTEVKIL